MGDAQIIQTLTLCLEGKGRQMVPIEVTRMDLPAGLRAAATKNQYAQAAWRMQEGVDRKTAAQTCATSWRRPRRRSAARDDRFCRRAGIQLEVGTVEPSNPNLQNGSDFPGSLEPRRMAEQALTARTIVSRSFH